MDIGTAFPAGGFSVGCNYWASHAGTNMWRNWREDVVAEDMRRLAQAGITTLRVFPLWSDFQPVRMMYTAGGVAREIRMGEDPLPDTPAGGAGVDEEMVLRLLRFCRLAQENGLRLVVALVTGWMSGRIYAPPLLDGKNLLTDPLALKWETKYARYLVRRLRDQPAVIAWEPGSECNCMGSVDSSEAFYVWLGLITGAIRAEDPTRPILTGMHGSFPGSTQEPEDLGELTDALCTHPYPLFTPLCDTDPMDRMKSGLHAAAESRLYADLSGKPCACEEAGTLGPMIADEETAARYARSLLFTLWAQDCRALLWWCAFDLLAQTHAPYDWNAIERELGLMRQDRSPKPVCRELSSFAAFRERVSLPILPERMTDAVCVLTRAQEVWPVAYGAFLMAKQAKLDLRFAWAERELPDAPAYLLPCLRGDTSISRRRMEALLARVRGGAKLYLSLDDGILSSFRELTGLRVVHRSRRNSPGRLTLGAAAFTLSSPFRLELAAESARVIAAEEDGNPALTVHSYGAGEIWLCTFPVERLCAQEPGIVDGDTAQPLWRIYETLGWRDPERVLYLPEPLAGLTEHPIRDGVRAAVVVNHAPELRNLSLTLRPGWRVIRVESPEQTVRISGETLCMGPNAGALLTLAREA